MVWFHIAQRMRPLKMVCVPKGSGGDSTMDQAGVGAVPRYLPSSCGNSSHRMATEVLIPWKTDTVKEAPIARPSMKLWRPSLRVIIQASVPMSE